MLPLNMEPLVVVVKNLLKFINEFKCIPDEYERAVHYLEQMVICVDLVPTIIQSSDTVYMGYFNAGIERIKVSSASSASNASNTSNTIDNDEMSEEELTDVTDVIDVINKMDSSELSELSELSSQDSAGLYATDTAEAPLDASKKFKFKISNATPEMIIVYLYRITEICYIMLNYEQKSEHLFDCIKAILIHIMIASSVIIIKMLGTSAINVEHKQNIRNDLYNKNTELKMLYKSLKLEGFFNSSLREFRL